MTRTQRSFVNQLVGNIKRDVLKSQIPAAWDGIELRWLIADKFGDVVISRMGGKGRKREYNNYRLVHNL